MAASSPLIKPDVRISRIRLARKLSTQGMHKESPNVVHNDCSPRACKWA